MYADSIAHALEDVVGTLRPAEGIGGLVTVPRLGKEGGFEFGHAAVDTAPQLPLGEFGGAARCPTTTTR